MSIGTSFPIQPTLTECLALARHHFTALSFDDVVNFESHIKLSVLAFGKPIQIPTLGSDQFLADDQVRRLAKALEFRHLIGFAQRQVKYEIETCNETGEDCNWQLDCLVLYADVYPDAASWLKEFYFEHLRRRFERDLAKRIFRACQSSTTSPLNIAN